jgi:hypothetical protein
MSANPQSGRPDGLLSGSLISPIPTNQGRDPDAGIKPWYRATLWLVAALSALAQSSDSGPQAYV